MIGQLLCFWEKVAVEDYEVLSIVNLPIVPSYPYLNFVNKNIHTTCLFF